MEEQRSFGGGGMNTDDAPQYVQNPDYIEAFNLELSGNVEGEAGDGTNLATTVEVLGYTMPTGLNKCIGAEKFEQQRVAYYFVYNSFGYHQLVELNYDTNTKRLLFTDLTDTDGVQVLALAPRNYVMDIKLIDGYLLVFTDSNIEIGYINLNRLKDGSYGVITIDDFRLIKAQPLKIPILEYGDDAGRVVNLLKGNLFQGRYQYGYLDDEPSAYSSISKRVTPTKESTTSIGEDVTKNNNITFTIDIGTDRVKDLYVAARYAMYDWFLIKSVTRNYVLSIPNTEIDIDNEIREAYDPATNTYSFVFYNDGSYVNIDPRATDQDQDNVPRKAQSLEALESNIIALAGITEGYERPVVVVNITVSDYDPQLEEAPTDPNPFRVATMYDTDPAGNVHKRKIWVGFNGVAKTGDLITIIVKDFRNATVTRTYTYIVESAYNNNTLGALQKMAVNMGNNGGSGGVGAVAYSTAGTSQQDISEYMLTWMDFEYYSAQNGYAKVTNASVGSGILSSIAALKGNSAYQALLQHYDRYGRKIPGNTGDNYIVKTSSYAQSKGLTPRINWQILSPPPPDAVSYQWLLSENTTHQNTLFVNSKYLRTDGDYIVLSINPLKIFNERNSSSILNYEYSEGDRATFMYYDNAGTKVYFDDPFIDVQVVGFEIVVDTTPDPDTTTWELKVRLNSNIVIADITNKNIYIEIYTPKKRVVVDGGVTTYLTNLFYEVGEQYNIVDGEYEVTSGTITDGDVYFQTRDYVSAVDETTYSTYLAEDFNFSPLYVSNYTSYGRGFLYNERDGIQIRKAGIRFSDKKVVNSKLNMINRFFEDRLYGDGDGETSSIFGWLRKIRLRGNYLVFFQENNTGHIPVFSSIIEERDNQTQAFLSDKLFNKARYSASGNIGIGNARECFAESPNGTMYLVDPNNSVPIREGYNGLTEISGKMSKFFKRTIQAAKQAGRDIIAYWNNFNKRVVYSIQVPADEVVQVPINALSLKYQDDYIIDKADITITQQMTKGTVAYVDGEWLITPNEGETGSDTFKYSFVVDGVTIEKNECVTIQPTDQTPSPFLFNDVVDADFSTMYISNLVFITGIDVPVAISIVDGEYSFDGVAWVSAAGTINPDTLVQVRRLSANDFNLTVSTTLTVGTYSDSFDITTKADVDPDPFSFTPVTEAEISTSYESNINVVAGLGTGIFAPISIEDGEYRINGGSWVSAAGTIQNGDTFQVRRYSSDEYETEVETTLTIGEQSATFSITTKEDTGGMFHSLVTGGTPTRGLTANNGGTFPNSAPYQWNGSLANNVIVVNELPGTNLNGWLSSTNHVLTVDEAGSFRIQVAGSGVLTFFNDVGQSFYGFADFFLQVGGTQYPLSNFNAPLGGFTFYYQYYCNDPGGGSSHKEASVAYSFTFDQTFVLTPGTLVRLYVSPRYAAVTGTPATLRVTNTSLDLQITYTP